MQQVALAGSIGAAVAAVAIIGAAGSTATPAAASHSAVGPHWFSAASAPSTLRAHPDATGSSTGAITSSATSAPSSTATSTASSSSTSTASAPRTTDVDDEPEEVDISAVPGPCTQDDVAASRWSTRVTVTNPADAGPLDYVALGINFNDENDDLDHYPHAGPLHLDAGETGSVVLTGPSDYFPDAIVVGGGISPDGLTAQVVGEVDVFDQQDFLKVAKVCGDTTPTPDPYDEETTANGYPGDGSDAETKTKTVTATVTVTQTQTVQVERPGMGEPPTPSPVTTRLPVAG